VATRTATVWLELNAVLSIAPAVSNAQVEGYLGAFRAQAEALIGGYVAAAPAGAQASLQSVGWRLEVGGGFGGTRPRDVEVDLTVVVQVKDSITDAQVWQFLAGYWSDGKAALSSVVANAPAAAEAQVLGWDHWSGFKAGRVRRGTPRWRQARYY